MTTATNPVATSRLDSIRPAKRKQAKVRLSLTGPTGCGKTWTALSLASLLAAGKRIVLIDSEPSDPNNTASDLYADHFDFECIDWRKPPFSPVDLGIAIKALGLDPTVGVVVVDSASPFWTKEGGTLDIADGRFGGWKVASPAQQELVEAILQAGCHVIVCSRAKMGYLVSEKGGKQSVERVGMEIVQRNDLEYEFQIAAMMTQGHEIDVFKDRCHLGEKKFAPNQQGRLAEALLAWANKGESLLTQADVDAITAAFGELPSERRVQAKLEFAAVFGKPANIPATRKDEVTAWLKAHLHAADEMVLVDRHGFRMSGLETEMLDTIMESGRAVAEMLDIRPEPAELDRDAVWAECLTEAETFTEARATRRLLKDFDTELAPDTPLEDVRMELARQIFYARTDTRKLGDIMPDSDKLGNPKESN